MGCGRLPCIKPLMFKLAAFPAHRVCRQGSRLQGDGAFRGQACSPRPHSTNPHGHAGTNNPHPPTSMPSCSAGQGVQFLPSSATSSPEGPGPAALLPWAQFPPTDPVTSKTLSSEQPRAQTLPFSQASSGHWAVSQTRKVAPLQG